MFIKIHLKIREEKRLKERECGRGRAIEGGEKKKNGKGEAGIMALLHVAG